MITTGFWQAYRSRQMQLKLKMIRESNMILRSVDFLESQVEKKMLEIEVAEANHNTIELEKLRGQLAHLLFKLNKEVKGMDDFMQHYSGMCIHEKETLLSRLGQEKQVSIRGVSPYTERQSESAGLSAQVKEDTESRLCSQIVCSGVCT
jgi:hypothetical protein